MIACARLKHKIIGLFEALFPAGGFPRLRGRAGG
jgi:hypothetical protein